MIPVEIPERLVKAIVFLRGEQDGRRWLAQLPERIATFSELWNLTPEAVADGGAMSCCVFCRRDDSTAAVLKIPVDEESGRAEVALLGHWAASSATPAVLESEFSSGVFLMTRIRPGTTAWAGAGADDSHRFGRLLARLNAPGLPAPPPQKDIGEVAAMRLDWARERFADPRYANDIASIEDAELVLDALLRSTQARRVLHADLQAKNVLQGPGGQWFAIDPLGATGDINAEAALWAAIQDGPASIATRLDELGQDALLDAGRLRAWTFVFAVAEYRPYLPLPARRIEEFLSTARTEELLELAKR